MGAAPTSERRTRRHSASSHCCITCSSTPQRAGCDRTIIAKRRARLAGDLTSGTVRTIARPPGLSLLSRSTTFSNSSIVTDAASRRSSGPKVSWGEHCGAKSISFLIISTTAAGDPVVLRQACSMKSAACCHVVAEGERSRAAATIWAASLRTRADAWQRRYAESRTLPCPDIGVWREITAIAKFSPSSPACSSAHISSADRAGS